MHKFYRNQIPPNLTKPKLTWADTIKSQGCINHQLINHPLTCFTINITNKTTTWAIKLAQLTTNTTHHRTTRSKGEGTALTCAEEVANRGDECSWTAIKQRPPLHNKGDSHQRYSLEQKDEGRMVMLIEKLMKAVESGVS